MARYNSEWGMTSNQQDRWILGEPSIEEVRENRIQKRLLMALFGGLGVAFTAIGANIIYNHNKSPSSNPSTPIVQPTHSKTLGLSGERYKVQLQSARITPS